ncbi:hypothetical protein OUZ56_018946 [Daphnia magna]|uniref:Uncharacterized protein n=1 Tax=Daphnia magna TaxID=35525 RepID=A0ABQ9ZAC7_9CRUS|nr:hypothetical protein OUZ56_018946 [Daphnia magna]
MLEEWELCYITLLYLSNKLRLPSTCRDSSAKRSQYSAVSQLHCHVEITTFFNLAPREPPFWKMVADLTDLTKEPHRNRSVPGGPEPIATDRPFFRVDQISFTDLGQTGPRLCLTMARPRFCRP